MRAILIIGALATAICSIALIARGEEPECWSKERMAAEQAKNEERLAWIGKEKPGFARNVYTLAISADRKWTFAKVAPEGYCIIKRGEWAGMAIDPFELAPALKALDLEHLKPGQKVPDK